MIYVVMGPTASGKSNLAERIASHLNCSIINADAFQIYKDMNIGTNKIDKSDSNYFRYRLLDIIDPSETYSVKQYQDAFRKTIEVELNNNDNVVICGGTGLYIKASMYDYVFDEEEDLNNNYSSFTNEQLYERLKQLDPISASKIHINNRKRVIRAIQIYDNNKMSKSELINQQNHELIYSDVIFIFINPPRDDLYNNINNRVNLMINKGLIDEVKYLKNKYDLSQTSKQAIGYKEILSYLNNEITKDEAIALIQKRTRNYAKRQITFFKNQFNYKMYESADEAYDSVVR